MRGGAAALRDPQQGMMTNDYIHNAHVFIRTILSATPKGGWRAPYLAVSIHPSKPPTHTPTTPPPLKQKQILTFVERRMTQIAPNVCALVGSKISSQLMGLAGGLVALSRIPANHIQVGG